MKRELALQLIHETLPMLLEGEDEAASIFRELQFLSDYKYNGYEMYHPGRLFLENLYLWLNQFKPEERIDALRFVREKLIFISRRDFQQLADILYHDVIRRQQIRIAAEYAGIAPYRIRSIRESPYFQQITRASLYVGMSDGARIDYIRRHNLEISNEQVLPYYEVSSPKKADLLQELRKDLNNSNELFHCLFMVDDFCGSGRTLLREVVAINVSQPYKPPVIPLSWQSRFRFSVEKDELELLYQGDLSLKEQQALQGMGAGRGYAEAIDRLIDKCSKNETVLKGALTKAADNLRDVLDSKAYIYLCPLLATQKALDRLNTLLKRLPSPFADMQILPGAVLKDSERIISNKDPIGALCENYYTTDFEDEHTGPVKFGFDNCGLPLVLHHNTPNNSIYLLWARKAGFTPLFVRYERHGREGT